MLINSWTIKISLVKIVPNNTANLKIVKITLCLKNVFLFIRQVLVEFLGLKCYRL